MLSLALIIERGLNLRRARVAPLGLVENVIESALVRLKAPGEHIPLSQEELKPLAASSAMGSLLAAGLAEWEAEQSRLPNGFVTDAIAFEKRLTLALTTKVHEVDGWHCAWPLQAHSEGTVALGVAVLEVQVVVVVVVLWEVQEQLELHDQLLGLVLHLCLVVHLHLHPAP